MKKNILKSMVILSAVFTVSCAEVVRSKSYDIIYDTALNVKSPVELSVIEPGTKKTVKITQIVDTKTNSKKINPLQKNNLMMFEDNKIEIKWRLAKKGMWFSLFNKTSENMNILWNKAVFADYGYGSRRLLNFRGQNNVIIMEKSFYQDYIFPENVDFESNNISENEIYFPSKIVVGDVNSEEFVYKSLNKLYDKFLNKPVKIVLPVQIGSVTYEYTFIFNINEINLSENND